MKSHPPRSTHLSNAGRVAIGLGIGIGIGIALAVDAHRRRGIREKHGWLAYIVGVTRSRLNKVEVKDRSNCIEPELG